MLWLRLVRQEIGPRCPLDIAQPSPHKMIDFMREDFNQGWRIVQEFQSKNNFATPQEARRENFIPRTRAKTQLIPIRTQLGRE